MFGFRRRGVAPVHAGMTVDEVRKRFTGAGWELFNAERTSVEKMAERRVGSSIDSNVVLPAAAHLELTCVHTSRKSADSGAGRAGCYHIHGTRR
jgi:hypothetical protein